MKFASLFKRFASIFYDLLVVLAILMLFTLTLVLLNGGNAINSGSIFYQVTLLTIYFSYYYYSLKLQGQTLGMKAWKIILLTEFGELPNSKNLLTRLAIAPLYNLPLMMGLWLPFILRKKITYYDHYSKLFVFDVRSKNCLK